MSNEQQLTEWTKEAMSGRMLKSVAEKWAPVIAKYLVEKMESEKQYMGISAITDSPRRKRNEMPFEERIKELKHFTCEVNIAEEREESIWKLVDELYEAEIARMEKEYQETGKVRLTPMPIEVEEACARWGIRHD